MGWSHAPAGVVAAAVEHAIAAAQDAGELAAADVAMIAVALKVARALDLCDVAGDTRGVVSAARELQNLLTQLGLSPARRAPAPEPPRKATDDGLAGFLAGLGAPTLGDPAQS